MAAWSAEILLIRSGGAGAGAPPLTPGVWAAAWGLSGTLAGVAEATQNVAEQRLVRAAARQVKDDATGCDADPGCDFDQLQPDRVDAGVRVVRAAEGDPPHPFEQHVGERREQQAELIRREVVATGAVGEQAQLLLLDPILHLATDAVLLVVDRLRRYGGRSFDAGGNVLVEQVRHHEPRVLALAGVLGFGDHPSLTIPCPRRVAQPGEPSLLLPGRFKVGRRFLHQFVRQGLHASILGQAEDILHAQPVAQPQQLPAAEPAIAAEDDPHVGPTRTDLPHQQRGDRPGVLGRVDVARPQVGDERLAAAEDVERQEAVMTVVTVEETAFLLAVRGVVGGVEVQRDLRRRLVVAVEELVDQNLLQANQRTSRDAVLQSAERRRTGERSVFPGLLFGRDLQRRIETQLLMIVPVFVAGRDGQDPLGEHRPLLMDDPAWTAWIGNRVIDGVNQAELGVGLPQQQQPTIGSEPAALEIRRDIPACEAFKAKRSSVTLCHNESLGYGGGGSVVTPIPTGSKALALAGQNGKRMKYSG